MAAPTVGVLCPWITIDDVTGPNGCCAGLAEPVNEVLLQTAIDYATNILFRASGRQFPGICERTVRPCAGNGCGCGCGSGNLGGWTNYWWNNALGGWYASSYPYAGGSLCGGCGAGCGGTCNLPSVDLSSPIASVEQVVIDGEILDPTAYKVQDYHQVVRVDGESFPCSNDRTRESGPYPGVNDGTRDGTWEISYLFGRDPGVDGRYATATYACQLALVMCNAADPNCRLPWRTQKAVREGITLDFIDPSLWLVSGYTGLPEVDAWIRSTNPAGLMRRSTIQRMGVKRNNLRSFTG